MDKNKDNTFDVPASDIQDKITLLMGLPPEEAAARLDKKAPPRRVVSGNPAIIAEPSTATQSPEPQPIEPKETTKNIEPTIADVQADDVVVDEIIAEEKNSQKSDIDKNEDYIIAPKPKKGIKKFILAWWHNRLIRNLTLLIIISILVAMIAIPSIRYATLNALGVRASLSVQTIDAVSGRPVKNVSISIGDVSAKTNQDGFARLEGLRLGESTIVMQKRSFKSEEISLTVGWGTNPFDAPLELIPTGTTFTFKITDWLSGTPLKNAEITDGESVAITDDSGEAKLTLEPTDADITITSSSKGYRFETTILPADTVDDQAVALVPAKRDVFISKRNGKYDIYSRYVDGRDEQVLLTGTGSEQIDTHVLNHPNKPISALVSSRDGSRSDKGNILSEVYIISIDNKRVDKISNSGSDRIRLIGWSKDSLIFVASNINEAATDNRQRLIAYDTNENAVNELASATYFTDVRVINDSIYYALAKSDGTQSGGLTKVSSSGKDKTVLLAKDIWGVYRTSKDTLQVSAAGDEWYEIGISENKVTKLEGAPPVAQNRLYITNSDASQAASLEDRDGKASLIIVDKNTNNQKEIIKQAGMTYPMQWLNDSTLLYTVAGPQETANYVVSTINGTSKRVGDVTVSVYNDSRYYY